MSPSKTLFCGCCVLVAGIAIASFIDIAQMVMWGVVVAAAAIAAAAILFQKPKIAQVGFFELLLVLGMTRVLLAQYQMRYDPIAAFNDTGKQVTLTGYVASGPDVRDTSQKIPVAIDNTHSVVLVTTDRFTDYHYLDQLKLLGKVQAPAVFSANSAAGVGSGSDFNYKNYLLKDQIYSAMYYPKITRLSENNRRTFFQFVHEKILQLAVTFKHTIALQFSGPQKALLEGVLLGSSDHLPEDLRNKLSATGLRYLTAISGFHIIVLSEMMLALFLALGFWRRSALAGSMVLVWLYVAMTGFSASGIRAAIMGSLLMASQLVGRQHHGHRVLLLAAAAMLLENPLLLRYDLGFQLSFLASFGIISVKPIIAYYLNRLTKGTLGYLVDMISVTLTAQLLTLPITMYTFGLVSFVAPITNVLIMPIFYWMMLFGLLSVLFGSIWFWLGFFFSVPCSLLLSYFLKIMDVFYQPWSWVPAPKISPIWLAGYYVGLVVAVFFLRKKTASELYL